MILCVSIIILLIGIGFFIYSKIKYSLSSKKIYNNILEERKEKLENELKEIFNAKKEYYDLEEEKLLIKKQDLTKEINEQMAFNAEIIASKEKQIDYTLENYKNSKIKDIDNTLTLYKQNQIEKIETQINNFRTNAECEQNNISEKINKLLKELNEYQKIRESINEAILREKEIREKENFYKICISNNDINDINILRQIENRLSNKEALNKLIYDVYIRRPSQEMIKRVLKGNSPSGIYKITFIKTGESYIGKSTNVNKRWTEHIKTSMGIGSIAHSTVHTKMNKEGLWNFTFELLEEVSKDKLSEREKYYIELYDTKNCGMNLKDGG